MSQELIGLPFAIQKMLVDKDVSADELVQSYIEVAKEANVQILHIEK